MCVCVCVCVCIYRLAVVSDSCDPIDYSPPSSSVHGIVQARILEWVATPFSRESSQSRIEPRSLTLQMDSLLFEPPGKPKNIGVGSLSLLQGIFLTQGSNQGLLHCRRILYQLSYQESPTDCQLQTGTCQEHCQWLNNSNKGICHLPLPLRRWNPALLQLLTLHSRWGSSGWSEALCAPGNLVEQVFR